MTGLKDYVDELKVRVFDLCLAFCWVVMDGHKAYMSEHKVHMFGFS
jgi:hypothetical protein